jgi:hypothetical protein
MKSFAQKHKGLITFLVAIVAALYQHYVEQIPQVDDRTWDAITALVGAAGAVHAGKSLGLIDILGLLRKLLGAKDVVTDVLDRDAERSSASGEE